MLLLKTTGILHSFRTVPKSDKDKVKGMTAVLDYKQHTGMK